MSKFEFQVGVHDGLIVVRNPVRTFTQFTRNVQISGGSSSSAEGQPKIRTWSHQARKAANSKARELGWII